MGKFENMKKPTARGILVAVVLAVILAALALFLMSGREEGPAGGSPTTEPQQTQNQTDPTGESTGESTEDPVIPLPELELPAALENGRLEVGSLFQSLGINPDCDNRDGDDIATIMLTNTSEAMLIEAKITAKLSDGSEVSFLATSLPAGKTAMVFSRENLPLAENAVCVEISCEAIWDETNRAMPEGVTAFADGMDITITNQTAQDISELTIYCRTPLGEEYFGGIAYEYKVDNLPAYGSTTFQATDCILGLAEVVRIEIK